MCVSIAVHLLRKVTGEYLRRVLSGEQRARWMVCMSVIRLRSVRGGSEERRECLVRFILGFEVQVVASVDIELGGCQQTRHFRDQSRASQSRSLTGDVEAEINLVCHTSCTGCLRARVT